VYLVGATWEKRENPNLYTLWKLGVVRANKFANKTDFSWYKSGRPGEKEKDLLTESKDKNSTRKAQRHIRVCRWGGTNRRKYPSETQQAPSPLTPYFLPFSPQLHLMVTSPESKGRGQGGTQAMPYSFVQLPFTKDRTGTAALWPKEAGQAKKNQRDHGSPGVTPVREWESLCSEVCRDNEDKWWWEAAGMPPAAKERLSWTKEDMEEPSWRFGDQKLRDLLNVAKA
jgi:hypothetical protein